MDINFFIKFLDKIFIDKCFSLYFYLSSSTTYDFYLSIFLNILAIFYFFLMLYVLNFIVFLRNHFFDDSRIITLLRILTKTTPEDEEPQDNKLEIFTFYFYFILTTLEVLIKTSFLILIGFFFIKFPFINLNPSPESSWKFADFFSKSRFYSFRPWLTSSKYTYRNFGGDSIESRASVNWQPERINFTYLNTLGYLHIKHFRGDSSNTPIRQHKRRHLKSKYLNRFKLFDNKHRNWSTHLLGARYDYLRLPDMTNPGHRYEVGTDDFFRLKSLELKKPLHSVFSYYRSEEDCYPLTIRNRFLRKFYFPGTGSKTITILMYEPQIGVKVDESFINREGALRSPIDSMVNIQESHPLEKVISPKEMAELKSKAGPEGLDLYKDVKEGYLAGTQDALKKRWSLNKNRRKFYGGRIFSDVDSGIFSEFSESIDEEVEEEGLHPQGISLFGLEDYYLDEEEKAFKQYKKHISNTFSEAERAMFGYKFEPYFPRRKPYLTPKTREETNQNRFFSDAEFSYQYNFRGSHIWRRNLLDFISTRVLRYLGSFSNRRSYKINRGVELANSTNIGLNNGVPEDLFGSLYWDREKYLKRAFEYMYAYPTRRSKNYMGKQDLSSKYSTAGSAYNVYFDEEIKVKDRLNQYNMSARRDSFIYRYENSLFNRAYQDRLKVNSNIFAFNNLKNNKGSYKYIKDKESDPEFFNAGYSGFLIRFVRSIYQFVLDNFTYWIRVIFGLLHSNISIPYFASPISKSADQKIGLNYYVFNFRILYFFRKLGRAIFFSAFTPSPYKPDFNRFPNNKGFFKDDKYNNMLKFYFGRSTSGDELSDFSLTVIKDSFSALFLRVIFTVLLIILNISYNFFNTIFYFAINHIFAFLICLIILALLRWRVVYPFEQELYSKLKTVYRPYNFGVMKIYSSIRTRFYKIFERVYNFFTVIRNFFTSGNMLPGRKIREPNEIYYFRAIEQENYVTSVVSKLRLYKIRLFLVRLGFSRFYDPSLEKYDKKLNEGKRRRKLFYFWGFRRRRSYKFNLFKGLLKVKRFRMFYIIAKNILRSLKRTKPKKKIKKKPNVKFIVIKIRNYFYKYTLPKLHRLRNNFSLLRSNVKDWINK